MLFYTGKYLFTFDIAVTKNYTEFSLNAKIFVSHIVYTINAKPIEP